MNIVPSRQFLLRIGTIVVLVGLGFGVWYFIQYRRKQEIIQAKSAQATINSLAIQGIQKINTADTDGDGVLDWEEALWGTDYKNPDTDGDGTRDDIEIAEKRTKAPKTTQSSQTYTHSLGRDIYATIAVLKQSDQLTPENQDRLSSELASEIIDAVSPPVYGVSDITTIPKTTTSTDTYRTTVANSVSQYQLQPTIIQGIFSAIQDGTPLPTSAITATSDTADFVRVLQSVSVPTDLVQAHLGLLNAVAAINYHMHAFVRYETDPLSAIGSMFYFDTALGAYTTALQQMYN